MKVFVAQNLKQENQYSFIRYDADNEKRFKFTNGMIDHVFTSRQRYANPRWRILEV